MLKPILVAALSLGLAAPAAAQNMGPAPALSPAAPAALPAAPAAAPAPAAHSLTREDAQAWLDGFIPYAIGRGNIAGAVVVVVKDGQVLLQKGYGYADAARHTPVDPENTLFRPGSVSKLFTWTAVMQLVEQGRIDLDRDVNTYLDFTIPPYQGKPVTMRNLMTHTAGFEERAKNLIFADPTPEPPIGQYLKETLPTRIFPAGEVPAYSNYGATLAGYVVQRLSGEAFDDYIDHHIFAPLRMAHASFRQPLPPALKALMSKGYDLGSGDAKPFEIVGPAPAGSSSVAAADMAHFMIAHLQDGEYEGARILQPQTAHLMHDTALKLLPPLHGMLLGFYQMDRNGHRAIGHGGDTQWFHSDLSLLPDDHVGLFISMNSAGSGDSHNAVRDTLFKEFMDRYFPAGPAAAPAPAPDLAQRRADGAQMAGTWVTSRREDSTILSMLNYLQPLTVTVDDQGVLTSTGLETLGNAPRKFDEVAPFLWRARDGQNEITAKRVDGKVAMWAEGEFSAIFVNTPAPWGRNAAWLLPALGASLAALLLNGFLWPAVALIRRRYRAPFPFQGQEALSYRLVRAASLADAALMLIWAGTVIYMLEAFALDSGMDPIIMALHLLSIVIFPGTVLIALFHAATIWRGRAGWGSWFARAWSAATVAASLVLLWTGAVFHLIGFNLAF